MPREPLVLVPGLKSDHRLWAAQQAFFAGRRTTVVPTAALGEPDIDAMARAALALCPPRFALAGASMGGYVALAMQRAAPERITRLALLATSARPDHPAAARARAESVDDARRRGLATMAMAGLAREFHRTPAADSETARQMAAMAETTGLETLARQAQACANRPDARPALARIAVPVLILNGARDLVVPPDASREMAALIGSFARHVELADCGHNLTIECADAVNAALAEWLDLAP